MGEINIATVCLSTIWRWAQNVSSTATGLDRGRICAGAYGTGVYVSREQRRLHGMGGGTDGYGEQSEWHIGGISDGVIMVKFLVNVGLLMKLVEIDLENSRMLTVYL